MPSSSRRPPQRASSQTVSKLPVAAGGTKDARSVNVAREAALAFLEADANGDGVLEWHEFKDAVKKLRSMDGTCIDPTLKDEEQLRALFDSIDLDKSGAISMDEYFLW